MTKTDAVTGFFELVRDYTEADATLQVTRSGSSLHEHVTQVVAELGPRQFTLTLPCMLCGGPISYETTVAAYAELHGPPRGICGRHG